MPPPVPVAMPESRSRSEAQFFHIGILGTTESGKTCFLAALAMPRRPHPLHYKATWIPPGRRPGRELTKGREWISEAINALREGRLPKGTPPDKIHAAVRYSLTTAEKDKRYLQIIDYAGELLDETKSADEIADQLGKKLEQMDGLLVLAPYPPAGGDLSSSPKALTTLCAAFNKIRQKASTRHIPIALAISKWDLSGHLDPEGAHEDQAAHVKAFLDGTPVPPMHAGVRDDLHASAWGECAVFAISAFGATTSMDTSKPKVSEPLMSYGLEEPLVWLTRQIVLQAQDELAHRLTWLSWFNPFGALITSRKTSRFGKRLMRRSMEAKTFRSFQWKARCRLVFSLAFWLLGSELAWDSWKHSQAKNSLADISRQGELNPGLDWLKEYGNASQFRHILHSTILPLAGYGLSKDAATKLVVSHYDDQENHLYEQIGKLDSQKQEEDLYKLTGEYLKYFPSGPHSSEISSLRFAIETRRDERLSGELFQHIVKSNTDQRWDEAYTLSTDYLQKHPRGSHTSQIAAIRSEIEQKRLELETENWLKIREGIFIKIMSKEIGHSERLDEVMTLADAMRAYPHAPLSGSVKNQWDALLKQLDTARKDLAGKMETEKERRRIDEMIQAKELIEAAEALADAQGRPDKSSFDDLLRTFRREMPALLKGKCETASGEGEGWQSAVKLAEEFNKPELRFIVEPLKDHINRLITEQRLKGDNYLYRLVAKHKNSEATARYLSEMPQGKMLANVLEYDAYLKEIQQPRNITIKIVQIDWSSDAKWDLSTLDYDDTRCEIKVNDQNDAWQDHECTREGSSAKYPYLASITLRSFRQIDDIKITVSLKKFVDDWGPGGHWEIPAQFKTTISPQLWWRNHGGRKELQEQTSLYDTVHFEVEGILPEPKLP